MRVNRLGRGAGEREARVRHPYCLSAGVAWLGEVAFGRPDRRFVLRPQRGSCEAQCELCGRRF